MDSKSARKREVLALQVLGEQLVGLTEEELQTMELEERLFDAVIAARKIKSRGALRRQCQLIGKLMKNVDPDPIRLALNEIQRQARTEKEIFRRAEYWRDRIVHDNHDALREFFEVTGRANDELSSLLQEYLASKGDSERTALRRKLFRQVHEELTVQNSAC